MNDWETSDSISAIALIGASGRFPGAPDIETFWRNLCDGIESISFFSEQEMLKVGIDPAILKQPNYVGAGGILEDVEGFDAALFGYTPGEAELIDPQHRLLLECAWAALENAGYDSNRYPGPIGIFAGTSLSYYLLHIASDRARLTTLNGFQALIGNDKDFLATRIAYKLNLRGPAISVQTACSTSLVAVGLACQSLLNYQCDMALAGGVSVHVPQQSMGYLYQEGNIFSPDGHCRAFDAQAQGTVNGNGGALVVLKRLEDALADGDHIHAVIRGFALNNDGSLKVGYTAPSVDSQAEVIATAQAIAGISADTITCIEAHGTGTTLGDPIEIAALTRAFRLSTERKSFCAIGSVKTNVGHLDAAAGVTSLIKTALAIEHKLIPPSLHFEQPNPKIDFANSPFYVNTRLAEWKTNGIPRRAGVSAFGIGGTNAHVILEEAPLPQPSGPSRPRQLLVLSAQTESALERVTANLTHYLRQPDVNLADIAHTLQVGRQALRYRRVLVCRDVADALKALETRDPRRVLADVQESRVRPIAFMFPGQGAQHVNMGRELYETEPLFRQELDRCIDWLEPHLGLNLRAVLYPADAQVEQAARQLEQTALTQPALFAVEYALARLWMSWGVCPQAMIGHSLGEYVAACLAGVFTLQDALALVATRGRLMQQLPGGAMLAVSLSEQEMQPFLTEHLSMAAINEPSRCVVSGPREAVDELEQQLAGLEIASSRLHTSHAFHSEMMDPILEPFTEQVKKITLNPPKIPYLSNVTGDWIRAAEATDPNYWAMHLRQTVRFAQGVRELQKEPERVFLEVGPGRTLSTLAKNSDRQQAVITSLRHPKDQQSDLAVILEALGKLWLAGISIDWAGFYANEQRQRVPLPVYPFEHQRYWIEFAPPAAGPSFDQPTLIKKPDVAEWFYIPSWKRTLPPAAFEPDQLAGRSSCWLVFTDECGLGNAIAEYLRQAGQVVISVTAGDEFALTGQDAYSLNPQRRDDYAALFAKINESGTFPQTIVHLWSVSTEEPLSNNSLDRSQDLGFYSLLFLAQALEGRTDSIDIAVVSNGAHRVGSEPVLCPEKATLLGPVRVIPQEYPTITCRNIDIVLPPLKTPQLKNVAKQLLAEFVWRSPEAVIAYRGLDRWAQTFEPVRLEEQLERTRQLLREKGIYVITGGLGGVGLELAEYLAQTVQARLALIGRSPFPVEAEWEEWLATHAEENDVSRKIRKLQALKNLGAQVMIVSADLADERQMQAALASVRERFGAINGVIHAAGVPGGGMIQLKTPKAAAAVLSPKVKGTWVLAHLLKDTPLDFLMLCSSLISLSGGLGRVDYCAANAFMDAFAPYNTTRHGVLTVAVNWDTWQGTGMAAGPARATPMGHPLLDERIYQTPAQAVYSTELSVARHWVLSEHRIAGKATLPGTAYLEMARAAFEAHTGSRAVELQEMFFLAPLMAGDDERKQIHIALKKEGNVFEISVTSNSGTEQEPQWQEHAIGKACELGAEPPRQHTIGEIIARCTTQDIVAIKKEHKDLYLGPRWQCLKEMYIGDNEALAAFELAPQFSSDLTWYKLHPALLDEATIVGGLVTEGIYLPLSYKSLKIKSPLPGKIYSYARYKEGDSAGQETIAVDLTLMDEQGIELVNIKEFTLKRVTDEDVVRLKSPEGRRALYFLPDKWTSEAFLEEPGEALLPREGVEAFSRILAHQTVPQVIVSTRDLVAWIKWVNTLTQSRLLKDAEQASLPGSAHPRPPLQTPYVAPTNELEHKLAEVWQKVLGIGQVGIHDNFFELGGDSLLGIQVLAQAKQARLELAARQLFQHQTIAELAAALGAALAGQAEQTPVTGSVPLTPIQHWFFAQDLPRPQHFDQTLLLETRRSLDPTTLKNAVHHLLVHHDALRLRFTQDDSGWQQTNAAPGQDLPFTSVDLSDAPAQDQRLLIELAAAALQASLNLSQGPLVRVALFNLAAPPNRLLIVIHHLAVDIGSWRILLQDLQTAYEQLERREAIQLPSKTGSFKQWAEALVRVQVTPQELAYWAAKLQTPVAHLPLDYPQALGANTHSSARLVSVSLDVKETRDLLQEVPQAYRTQTDQVLLTALARILADQADLSSVWVDLESDGREARVGDVDVSRTVGWFTTLYPALLQLGRISDPGAALKTIKEQLRTIPSQGLGYGLLRYLGQETEIMRTLDSFSPAEIGFIYMGQLEPAWPETALYGLAGESSGPNCNPQGRRSHLLELEASVVQDRLQVNWIYSEKLHRRATIESWAAGFMEALRSLIAHCLSPKAGAFTPSDFAEAGLSQAALDEIVAEFDDLDFDEGN